MDSQLKKGILDVCVLHAISNGESYGYKIIREYAVPDFKENGSRRIRYHESRRIQRQTATVLQDNKPRFEKALLRTSGFTGNIDNL